MSLESLVPSLELCQRIPEGEFGESALVWEHAQRLVVERKDAIKHAECKSASVMLYPAPTLSEILAELPKQVQFGFNGADYLFMFIEHEKYNDIDSEKIKNNDYATAALRLWLKLKGGGK